MNSVISVSLLVLSGFALIVGKARWAAPLALSAVLPWVLGPLASAILASLPVWIVVIVLPVLIIAMFFRLLTRSLSLFFGSRDVASAATGHLAGTWLVRVGDAVFSVLSFMVMLPFRLIAVIGRFRA